MECEPRLRSEYFTEELLQRLSNAFCNRENYIDLDTGAAINAQVYPVVILPNILNEDFFTILKEELSTNIVYREKWSDLYHFKQTDDLKGHSSKPIQQLKEVLLSETFISSIEGIVGKPLSRQKIDLSSQNYGKGNFLLTHDDRLDSRRIAFVLYLVDPTWSEADGGSLDFFPTDFTNSPVMMNDVNAWQRFFPKENTLVFFEVSMSSHHQVSEVLQDSCRISIAGWLHDPNPGEVITLDVKSKFVIPSTMIQTPLNMTIKNAFTLEVHTEFTQYFDSRISTSFEVNTPEESFTYYQEISEPKWMRHLLSNDFKMFLSSITNTKLDWPTRPIVKYYTKPSHYRGRPLQIHESGSVLKVFIAFCKNQEKVSGIEDNSLTLFSTSDFIIPGNSCGLTLIEMEYSLYT